MLGPCLLSSSRRTHTHYARFCCKIQANRRIRSRQRSLRQRTFSRKPPPPLLPGVVHPPTATREVPAGGGGVVVGGGGGSAGGGARGGHCASLTQRTDKVLRMRVLSRDERMGAKARKRLRCVLGVESLSHVGLCVRSFGMLARDRQKERERKPACQRRIGHPPSPAWRDTSHRPCLISSALVGAGSEPEACRLRSPLLHGLV